jgi:hypothetical protein
MTAMFDPSLPAAITRTGQRIIRDMMRDHSELAPQSGADPMTRQYVLEATIPKLEETAVSVEDGGRAVIVDLDPESETGGDGCFFLRLQSWDETGTAPVGSRPAAGSHPLIRSLLGKKVRITVEVIQ